MEKTERIERKKLAILAFGGAGIRFGWVKPKQFFPIKKDKTLLEYLVEKFLNFNLFDDILVLSPPNYIEETKQLLEKYGKNKVHITCGGNTREHSIWNGLLFFQEHIKNIKDDDIVLIHDGARPNIDKVIVEKNLESCEKYHAVVTAIMPYDTVSFSNNGCKIDQIINRNNIKLHQTPQTFKFGIIKNAMEKNIENLHQFSDDASLVIASGYDVFYIEGSRLNIKITTREDLLIVTNLIF
ncbi:MAG: IspD/TarI family cytidylyltransferase [Fervidobacterium sp.]